MVWRKRQLTLRWNQIEDNECENMEKIFKKERNGNQIRKKEICKLQPVKFQGGVKPIH